MRHCHCVCVCLCYCVGVCVCLSLCVPSSTFCSSFPYVCVLTSAEYIFMSLLYGQGVLRLRSQIRECHVQFPLLCLRSQIHECQVQFHMQSLMNVVCVVLPPIDTQ